MGIQLSGFWRASEGLGGSDSHDFSFNPTLTSDGGMVAFESRADNLVSNDFNGFVDVFVRDLATGQTTRVSDPPGGGGAGAPADSYNPMISGDGSTVVFESFGSGFIGNDFNGQTDIFARDLMTGDIERVSVDWLDNEIFGGSFNPSLSDDGRYVAYETFASGVTPDDFNGHNDVFVRDTVTDQTLPVSSIAWDQGPTNGSSFDATISGNGQFVVFASDADNLIANDFNFMMDVFVHDLATQTTERISQGMGGVDANGFSSDAAISADGRYVAYISDATNITADANNGFEDVFLHDRQTGTTMRVSGAQSGTGTDLVDVSISPDGRFITYGSFDPFNPPGAKTYAHDVAAGMTTELVGIGFGGETDFSADNSKIAFTSEVDGLVPNDGNFVTDTFVADTGIQPPPPTGTIGPFSDGDDTVDLAQEAIDLNHLLDYTHAMDGADTVMLAEGGFAAMPFFGGAGNDILIGTRDVNFLSGDAGNDTLIADDGNDGLFGGDGIDMMFGGNGDDSLAGGLGRDRLFGEAGMDMLDGGNDDDELFGGMDADIFIIGGAMPGMDLIRDFMAGEDTLVLQGVHDAAGAMVTSFAQLDSDASGMLDAADSNIMIDNGHLKLTLMGGGVTIEGQMMLDSSDVAIS